MPQKLYTKNKDFALKLKAALGSASHGDERIAETVSGIIHDVKKTGDKALFGFTEKFDHWGAQSKNIKVSPKEFTAANSAVSDKLKNAIETAIARVRFYHEKQLPQNHSFHDEHGIKLGWRWTAVESAGLYVPGGTAALPSSVYMNAIPAIMAGVKNLVMVTPAPDGKINPAILVAAQLCGISEVYKIGGAQAIAALAYGTNSIPAVCKVVGPGNAYVAEAKRQLFGVIGIDTIAGPSDVTVIADDSANPAWVAADMLAQAEHDVNSRAILITSSESLASTVEKEIENQLITLPRKHIALQSWASKGLIIILENMGEAAKIASMIAPEHLEIITRSPDEIADQITNAGAIFIGRYASEALGDYIAGPSHVLPTSGAARFSSGLSVLDFMKRSSIISVLANSCEITRQAILIAEAEELDGHANSLRLRMDE